VSFQELDIVGKDIRDAKRALAKDVWFEPSGDKDSFETNGTVRLPGSSEDLNVKNTGSSQVFAALLQFWVVVC
jgi:hypothetical protein